MGEDELSMRFKGILDRSEVPSTVAASAISPEELYTCEVLCCDLM